MNDLGVRGFLKKEVTKFTMTLDVAKGWNLKGGVFFLCSPEQSLFFKATDSLTQRWNCTQTGYSHPQDLS